MVQGWDSKSQQTTASYPSNSLQIPQSNFKSCANPPPPPKEQKKSSTMSTSTQENKIHIMPSWIRLPAWLHRKVKPPVPPEDGLRAYVDQFLDSSVLWFLFGVLIAVSGAMLGFSVSHYTSPENNTRFDDNFYNYMSQTFMTILACYCTLLPVLHAHLNKKVGFQLGEVAIVVFYVTVGVALTTAVASPIVYAKSSSTSVSNALSFASSVCSVVTASQLAAGVLQLGRPAGEER